jgi:glyoxylase-like metal-dependent hydrolase (beta-lactamase superfamily II)
VLKLGDAEIRRVEETASPMEMATLTTDEAFLAANRSWLCPSFMDPVAGTFSLIFQSWLVSSEAAHIVIDPCNGNGRLRPVLGFAHQLNIPYIERFEATGIRPQDVDLVFCTHLHCDHCGWNTQLRDGRWTPTFPNARYVFVRRELDRWDPRLPNHQRASFNDGVFEDSVVPIFEAGLADAVGDTHELGHGLTIEPAYGHTLGHSLVHLKSGGAEAYFTGDAFHHPLQILRPELGLGGCDDNDAAIATRRRLVELLAERDAVMFPAHFQAPHAGRVRPSQGGYRFEPLI